MFHRTSKLPPRRSVLLLGPRQVGKSTFVKELLPAKAWSIDLLESDTFLRYAKDPSLFRNEASSRIRGGTSTIFVDEVQKVPALLDEVQFIIDRGGVRVILTGSSARKLRRGGANLLGGRLSVRHLHPLTAREMGDRFDLSRVLRLGSLPQVASSSESTAREILRSYGETYLREEIQAEALVRNLGGFGRFLDVVAATSGDIVNFSNVGRDAGLATRTVSEYFQILEDTLVGLRLEAWRNSPRARMVAHPKFYLFDTGVTNALARRLSADPAPERSGRLFEQWVVLECWRTLDYLGSEARLFYWRTHLGAEVDLVVELHGRLVLAIEVKSGRTVGGSDTSGLRTFRDAHPEVPCVIACMAREEHDLNGISVLPWQKLIPLLQRRVAVKRPATR